MSNGRQLSLLQKKKYSVNDHLTIFSFIFEEKKRRLLRHVVVVKGIYMLISYANSIGNFALF